MISRTQTKYALEFFGKSIILLSSKDEQNWVEIGLADMGDPDFREMMKDFLAEVSAHGLLSPKVGLFLPQEDVILRTITGPDHEQALAQVSQIPIQELSFTLGTPNQRDEQNVLFAYRDTLQEAQKFIGQFGFKVTYFSARVTLDGFATQPKIYLESAVKNATGLALWPSLAAAAVVAVGAFSLWASYGSHSSKPAQSIQLSSFSPAPAEIVAPTVVQKPAQVAKVLRASVRSDDPLVESATSSAPVIKAAPQTLSPPVVDLDATATIDDVSSQPSSEQPVDLAALARSKEAMRMELDMPTALKRDTPLALDAGIDTAAIRVETTVTDVVETDQAMSAATIDIVETDKPLLSDQASSAPSTTTVVPETDERAVPETANYPRPKLRSGSRTAPPDAAPAETVAALSTAAAQIAPKVPRPKLRPNTITAATLTSTDTQAAIAKDLVNQAIAADTASLANASKRAIGTNKRPPLKSSKFRTVANNLRQPSKPAATTVTASVATSTATATAPSAKPAVAAPVRKEKSTGAATTFNKRSLSLVGVFGTPSRRSALFRTSTGSYRSVKIGQRISGWKVVAIGESSAKVSKGSRSKTMRIPN